MYNYSSLHYIQDKEIDKCIMKSTECQYFLNCVLNPNISFKLTLSVFINWITNLQLSPRSSMYDIIIFKFQTTGLKKNKYLNWMNREHVQLYETACINYNHIVSLQRSVDSRSTRPRVNSSFHKSTRPLLFLRVLYMKNTVIILQIQTMGFYDAYIWKQWVFKPNQWVKRLKIMSLSIPNQILIWHVLIFKNLKWKI